MYRLNCDEYNDVGLKTLWGCNGTDSLRLKERTVYENNAYKYAQRIQLSALK